MEMSKIVIGAMRFKDRKSAVETIHKAIDCGFNYIDTSPCYCYTSEKENSESWVGEAVNHPDYPEKAAVSTKCSPGNGGLELGDFKPEGGFGVRTIEQLKTVFQQSLTRMNLQKVDYYHLWTVHTHEQVDEAFKKGGWYDGVMEMKDKGKFQHLGITTHADPETIINFLKKGKFKIVTLPLNVINTTREGVLDFCRENNIKVIAMNPLAGGFLAVNEKLKELALRYLMKLSGVHLLIGFSKPEEVEYAKWILDTDAKYDKTADQIKEEVSKLINTDEPRCTACGYCLPCPEKINIGASLSYYNIYKYMKMDEAKAAFVEKQWEDGLKLEKCTSCGQCEERCPNKLPTTKIIQDAIKALYAK